MASGAHTKWTDLSKSLLSSHLTHTVSSEIFVFFKECIGFIGAPNLGLFTVMDHSFKMIFLLAFLVEEGPSFFSILFLLFLHSEVL